MKSVCIICGGQSHEHEISLISASSILKNINRDKYDVSTVIIDKDGSFFATKQTGDLSGGKWKDFSDLSKAIISPSKTIGNILKITGKNTFESIKVDAFFPVLHGENGEDGVMQGLLTLSGVAFVGGGTLNSASCMDKEVTHIRLEASGIKTAPYIVIKKDEFDLEEIDEKIKATVGYPAFAKPANAGSSIGVGKIPAKENLKEILDEAFLVDNKVLIEKCIVGSEVECAVMGNDEILAADFLGEIAPTAEFYDFDAKYADASTELFIPARISEALTKKVREIALKAYKALDCKGLSRVDFFVTGDGEIILNEINTLPGFTSISMYPKLFEASGISYSELIDKLISLASVK